MRNTFVSMVRARRTVDAGDAIEEVVGDRGADVASLRSFDGSTTAKAFLSLPARWQEVLWYLEVEGFSRERTAEILGMNANAVSALSFRAREALRTAWVQQHVGAPSDLDRGCEAISPLLGAHSRRGLSRRDRLRVEHHLTGCGHCRSIVDELSELLTPGRLALALLPLVVTGGGFAAWAARFGVGSTSIGPAALASASAAAPSTALLASVGGSTGAAALSVVGKVAACAVAVAMIVPPAQMLIVGANDAPLTPHSSSTIHRAVLSEDGSDQVSPTGPLVDESPQTDPTAPADADDPVAGGRPEWAGTPGGNPDGGGNAAADAAGDAGGNANAGGSNPNAGGGNPNAGGSNPNAGGGNPNAGGGNPNAGGGNANANPNAGATGNTNSKGNANASANSSRNANANANANANGNGNGNGNGNADGNANGKGQASGNASPQAGDSAPNGAAASNGQGSTARSANANSATTPGAKGGPAEDAAPTTPTGP